MTRVIIIIHLIGNIAEGMPEKTQIAESINTTSTEDRDRPRIHILPAATEIDATDQELHHPETTKITGIKTQDTFAKSPKNMRNAVTTRKGILHLGAKTKRETAVNPKKYTPTSKNVKEELIKTAMKFTGMASSGSRRPRR